MRLITTVFVGALLAAGPAAAQTPPAAPAAPAPPAAPTSVVLQASSYSRYHQANQVELRDVAAYVRVRPEHRTDVAIAVINNGPLAAPRIRVAGGKLIVDGGLRRQITDCEVEQGNGFEVATRRHGRVADGQLPIIELRVPQAVSLSASGAVRLRVGPSQSAEIALGGCGDADIERVQGVAEVALSGTPDVRLYDVGELSAAVAGQGDVVVGVARRSLTLSIAGAGDFVVQRADGPTNIAIQGAGDVLIRDGQATAMSVAIAGAGDVTHNGSAERLDVTIFGAGDVHVGSVSGPVNRRIFGGGEVTVGR